MLSQEPAFQEARLPRLSTNFWKLCLLFRYLVKLHRAETRTEICVQFQHHCSLLIFLTVTLSSSLSTWDDVQMSNFLFISVPISIPISITLPHSLENFIRKLFFFSFSFFLSPSVLPCTHDLPRNKCVHLRCFLSHKMTGSPMTVALWCQLWALNLT